VCSDCWLCSPQARLACDSPRARSKAHDEHCAGDSVRFGRPADGLDSPRALAASSRMEQVFRVASLA
jgi:hypothetical protein